MNISRREKDLNFSYAPCVMSLRCQTFHMISSLFKIDFLPSSSFHFLIFFLILCISPSLPPSLPPPSLPAKISFDQAASIDLKSNSGRVRQSDLNICRFDRDTIQPVSDAPTTELFHRQSTHDGRTIIANSNE